MSRINTPVGAYIADLKKVAVAVVFLLLCLPLPSGIAQDTGTSLPLSQSTLDTSPLYIEIESGRIDYSVEVADTPETTARGLMFRESLGDRAGMLFVFSPPREPSMWMKNTLIPLDMLFLDGEGEIIAIARNAVPGSLRHLSPEMPVSGVLEINGGQAATLNIRPGDRVHHAAFNNFEISTQE